MTRIPWSLYRLTQRAFSTSGSATKRTSSWPPQRKIFWLPSWFRPKTPPEWTEFDTMWNDASEEQRDLLRTQYDELQKRDWRTLSVDQLRNCYTVSYGPPDSPSFDRREKILVFFGTVIAVSAGVGLFYFLQLFGKQIPYVLTL